MTFIDYFDSATFIFDIWTIAIDDSQINFAEGSLANHLVYARRPDLFRAVRGMWSALDNDGILGAALVCLVNRRVAALNGCTF